jgi:predicted DCC family thiol-disulfide oxidoreductase YuxK
MWAVATAAGSERLELTLLYDGGCPLCVREVGLLERRDRARHGDQPRLAFVDIDRADYNSVAYAGITYRQAMGRIHAITAAGEVLRDVAVFRRAYALIGLGWLYGPTRWPGIRQLADQAYGLWAASRLKMTGRPDLETLCRAHMGRCPSQ